MVTLRSLWQSSFLLLLFLSAGSLVAQGPVAWYPFNGNANDAGGHGLNGVVNGAVPTLDRFGNCNSAYAFNGAEHDHIVVNACQALSFGTHDFTVVSWIKFCGQQPEYAGIVCKGPPNNSYPGYQLHIADHDKFTTQIGDERNWADEKRGYQALSDGRWHMVAVTVSPAHNAVTLYVDGELVEQYQQHYTRRGPLNVSRFDPTPLFIGTERNFDRFFTGVIDDVRLYDRLLPKCDLDALYRENGWTGESRLPEPRITITGPSSIRSGETTRLSVDCYPVVLWSTGATTSSITVDHPGVYTATVSDGSGCQTKTVTVSIAAAPCRDSLLFSLTLPYRCVGSAERVELPLINPTWETMVIQRVEFPRGAEYVEFGGTLPIVLQPGGRLTLPVGYRWLAVGEQITHVRIVTGSGRTFLIEIRSKGLSAFGPIFNTSDIRFPRCSGWVDTCIVVTNTTGMKVTLTTASWLHPGTGFRLIGPALPFTVRPGETVRLCVGYQGHTTGDANVLVLGGEGVDRYGEISECVVHRFNVQVGKYVGHGGVDHIDHDPGSSGSGSSGSDSSGVGGGSGSGSNGSGSGSSGSDSSGTGSGSGSNGSGSNGSGSQGGGDSLHLSGVDERTAFLSASSLALYPIPAADEIVATFGTNGFGYATLELFDVKGESKGVVFEKSVEGGMHTLHLTVQNFSPGVYFLRLKFGTTVHTCSLVIRR